MLDLRDGYNDIFKMSARRNSKKMEISFVDEQSSCLHNVVVVSLDGRTYITDNDEWRRRASDSA